MSKNLYDNNPERSAINPERSAINPERSAINSRVKQGVKDIKDINPNGAGAGYGTRHPVLFAYNIAMLMQLSISL